MLAWNPPVTWTQETLVLCLVHGGADPLVAPEVASGPAQIEKMLSKAG